MSKNDQTGNEQQIQFKIICIVLFTKQSLQSSFTGNYISTIDIYILQKLNIFNLWQNLVNSVYSLRGWHYLLSSHKQLNIKAAADQHQLTLIANQRS